MKRLNSRILFKIPSISAVGTFVLYPLIVLSLQPTQINKVVKKFVVKIDGDSRASGVIAGRNNNNYQVMTVWHAVKESGRYTVQTYDGVKHDVISNTIKRIPALDIAIVEFTSKLPYSVAKIGNSKLLTEGENVFLAGFPKPGPMNPGRDYRFEQGMINTLMKKETQDGYSIVYDNRAIEGMSGGPVFNDKGEVIAINGATEIRTLTGASGNYGTASEKFINWQQKVALLPREFPTVFEDPKPLDMVLKDALINLSSNGRIVKSRSQIKYIWPATGTLISRWGKRGEIRKEINIGGPVGTPIHAVADGIVLISDWSSSGRGYLVAILHPDDNITLYSHNSKLLVSAGQTVRQSQQIAEMGSTGNSTGPHLRFEMREKTELKGYSSVDPLKYLPGNL